jgi:hypothetical protein
MSFTYPKKTRNEEKRQFSTHANTNACQDLSSICSANFKISLGVDAIFAMRTADEAALNPNIMVSPSISWII